KKEYFNLLGTGLQKICLGLVYKFVISAILYGYLNSIFAENYDLLHTIGYAYCYGFYLFFDFAGYSLMAVGVSYILGIKTPDNFKWPFISKDIADFWNRWHISLSHWFRDFIFSRFMVNAIRGKWFKKKLNGACVGLIINMTIMGVWHGLTSYYIAYGIYHGVLLAATEIWQKKSPIHKKYKKKKGYIVLSWFVTINLVMLGFLIFSGHGNVVLGAWIGK
ncbi:MAG: MBOAT family O-acyltransferase, partial [Anaerovoracaceae bacterium]